MNRDLKLKCPLNILWVSSVESPFLDGICKPMSSLELPTNKVAGCAETGKRCYEWQSLEKLEFTQCLRISNQTYL